MDGLRSFIFRIHMVAKYLHMVSNILFLFVVMVFEAPQCLAKSEFFSEILTLWQFLCTGGTSSLHLKWVKGGFSTWMKTNLVQSVNLTRGIKYTDFIIIEHVLVILLGVRITLYKLYVLFLYLWKTFSPGLG